MFLCTLTAASAPKSYVYTSASHFQMSTTAQLSYSHPPSDGSPAWSQVDFDRTVASEPPRNWIVDLRKVEIKDARGNEDKYTLDTVAFQFYRRPAKHTRFQDEEEVKAEYYPECAELIKELTGASRVIPFGHSRLPTYPLIVTYSCTISCQLSAAGVPA